MTVNGLTPGDTYYFAVRAQDEVPNTGGLSNSPSAVASLTSDATPPAAITKFNRVHRNKRRYRQSIVDSARR